LAVSRLLWNNSGILSLFRVRWWKGGRNLNSGQIRLSTKGFGSRIPTAL